MKHCKVSIIAVLAVTLLLWSQPLQPVFEWYSLGPAESAINCVLVDDTAKILAGTDNGVMVRCDNKWHQATSGMPVRALARLSKDRVAAAIGDGKSKSDGIYIGSKILGPPYYQFSLLFWTANPEALLASESGDTLYAGGGNALYRCVMPKQSDPAVFKPETIGLPEYAFGVEMPSCRTLGLFSERLVAGGYDRSPNPGPGHLLYNNNDSMRIERQMNVSALAVQSVPLSAGAFVYSLVVGTIDSGIFIGLEAGPTLPLIQSWTRIDGPNKESVTAMSIAPLDGGSSLIVAVKSGVFTPDKSGKAWLEVGSIPAVPLCLACSRKNGWTQSPENIYAGTDHGVYRYGPLPSTGIQTTGGTSGASTASLRHFPGSGESRIVFTSGKTGGAEIAVNDLSGRLLCKFAVRLNAGVNSVTLPLDKSGRGLYTISVRGENLAPLSRTVTPGR